MQLLPEFLKDQYLLNIFISYFNYNEIISLASVSKSLLELVNLEDIWIPKVKDQVCSLTKISLL